MARRWPTICMGIIGKESTLICNYAMWRVNCAEILLDVCSALVTLGWEEGCGLLILLDFYLQESKACMQIE